MNKEANPEKESETIHNLLDSENRIAPDWHSKLEKIDKARVARHEAQKARKGKPITFSRT